MTKKLVLCDCLGSQVIDADRIGSAAGLSCSRIYSSLCMDQLDRAAAELSEGDVVVACQQERQRFLDLAAEIGAPVPSFVDLRDRAGWNDGTADPAPKMAALAAEAVLPIPLPRSLDVMSEGTCLVVGAAAAALPAADHLCESLAVTVLLTDEGEQPEDRRFDCIRGTLKRAKGALGSFEVRIDQLQQPVLGGRGGFEFTPPKNGGVSTCDIILDLRGDAPLFPAHEKREGYLRADPGSPLQVASAVIAASNLVGTFEKPLYVRLEPSLCAHSRAEQTGCTRCLNVCPTGAITPAGEHVEVDPMICAGCGSCSAVCPSAAISYDAPPVEITFRRIATLASTYRKAKGENARLLVHDDYGVEMIALAARYGAGLPVEVIPIHVEALSSFGHAEMLAALAAGFGRVDILCGPKAERDVVEGQVALAAAISGADAIAAIDPTDPDDLVAHLNAVRTPVSASADPILPIGTRRQVTRLAAKSLRPDAETIDLPSEAPYGAVLVDTEACTLCLSCVSLCPSGALADNPDLPQLRFQEDACLQCGLCANVCPEDAISYEPRLNLTDAALTQVVLNEEEPFACIECGALFGVKSTVERIMEKLSGVHPMFATSDKARMIQMCDNCRIQAQFHSEDNPFAAGERPRVRTTEDYLSKRKDH